MTSRMRGLGDAEADAWIGLTVLSQLLPPAMDRLLGEVGLTLFEYGTLMSLADAPGQVLRIATIAERTYAPLPRVSKVVARLEERGLLGRSRSVADRRASDIELTAEGRKVLRRAHPVQVRAARELLIERLTAEQVTALGEILGRLVGSLDPGSPLGD